MRWFGPDGTRTIHSLIQVVQAFSAMAVRAMDLAVQADQDPYIERQQHLLNPVMRPPLAWPRMVSARPARLRRHRCLYLL